MISNKQIVEGVRKAPAKAFKAWLEENRTEIVKLVAESVAVRIHPSRPPEPKQAKLTEQFFTPAQLAERWHLHPVSVLRMIRRGALPCIHLNRRRKLVPVSAVEEYEKSAASK
jgi:hypothetical protein